MRATISSLFAVALALATSVAAANSAFPYMKENLTIYEVVVADETGPIKEEPGIYSLDERGNSKLVVPGTVVGANRNFKGIVAYGPANASRSSAHDALAVVDGEIVVFNRYTDPKKAAATSVVLGDKVRGVEIIDALTGLPVTLPKIDDISSLVIRSGTHVQENTSLALGGHFMIMSVKAPSHLGDGLTFAFVLETVRTGRPRIMGGRALLISHSFLSRDTLDRLLVHQPPSNISATGRDEPKLQIYAPSIISRFKTQIENKSTSPVVKNWIDHIERFEDYVREGIRSNSKVDPAQMSLGIPIFDMFTRRDSLPMSPIETITEDQQSVIGQIFNHVSSDFGIIQAAEGELQSVPVGKNNMMRFIHAKAAEHRQIAHLPVDRDPKTGKHRFLVQSDDEMVYMHATGKSYILFSGKSAYLMARPMTSGPKGAFTTVQIKNPVLGPDDKIEFLRRPMEVNGHAGSVVLIWRKKFTYADNIRGKKEERAELHALLVDESDGMQIVGSQQLYDGTSPLTFEETRLRLVEHNGRILFDKTSAVRGAKRYESGDQFLDENGMSTMARHKTTPYEEVSRKAGEQPKQSWLRTLINQVIVQDVLTYREYNETGARESASGFYLETPPATEEGKRHTETLIRGIPLNNYTGKLNDFPSYTLLAKSLYQPWGQSNSGPNVAMTVIPFDPSGEPRAVRNGEPVGKKKKKQLEEDQHEFRIALLFSPDRIGLTKSFQPVLRNLRVPRPYKNLQFAQVVQGTKNRANEVSILLSFRADPKVPDSIDEVLITTATLAWNGALVGDPFSVQLTTNFEQLHRGLVIPSAVHSHLRVDAEGSFFWVHDPTGDRQSPQYKVTKLTTPGQNVRSSSGHNNLREPDEIRETDVGYVGGKRAVGGRWEILTAHALSDAVSGLRDQSDKRVTRASKKRGAKRYDDSPASAPANRQLPSLGDGAAEQLLLTQFENTLDDLAKANGPHQLRRPRIFVVAPALKEKFKWSLFTKLALDSSTFSLQNAKMRFFNANTSLDDVEVAEELQYIRETTQEKARILYVDQDQLRPNGSLKMRNYDVPDEQDQGEDFNREDLPFPLDEPSARPNMLVLLASGGQAKSLKGYDKVTDRQTPVPMISIVTPDEWREIQKDQSSEIQSGVLDNVTVDYDYLTTDWTMWSPRSQDKAAEDVKRLAKRPYRSEEMRVFPTLERVLNQAARGENPGKKTLILVPEELKQLVQTLVVTRWSTQEPSSGDWSYRNQKLALARVGTHNMKHQSTVLDNFRALRGAAGSRHSVLYADLDTIAKVRRPDQDADSRPIYRLKDPVQSGSNAMFGEYEQKAPAEKEASENDVVDIDEEDDEGSQRTYLFSHEAELDELREEGTTVEKVNMHIAQTTAAIESLNFTIDEYQRAGRPQASQEFAELVTELADRTTLRREMIEIKKQIEEYQAELAPEDRDQPTAPRDPAPHIMWLIAGEGHQIQPSPKADWSLSKSIDPKITSILIGTPEELEKIETDLQTEAKYFNLRKEFDVISLEAPSEDTKVKLVQQLFDRPEVLQMGLSFKLKRDNGHDPREQLIYHFINRIDELAYDQKISKTNAFIRAYLALQHHLVDDAELYAHRTVSEKFIERLFTKVFPMPLNREILEANDPLNRLANEDQAVRDLTQAGVEGSPDLKRRVFENMLSQTRPTDTSRPIPNSQIFFGNTSTGKTFFLERLFKMFGFTEYSSSRSNNEDADYIMIKVSKITSDDNGGPDFVSIKDTLENISDLLAQPKGARAHIVFDDYHTAQSKDVREKLYQFIRGLLESPNGMYVAQRKSDGRRVEIPVQNLNLWMTINPQADEMARRRFIKQNLTGLELLKREVLSAMAGENFTFEESILARFGDIIDFDKFPRSAKVPELVRRVRANQIPGGQMVLVDPQVIFNLIDKYPEAHARELLSPATSALTQIPRDVEEGPIYLVSNKGNQALTREPATSGGVSQQELSKAVRSSTRVETIRPNEPRALESFMGFMMHNFRLQMFNQIVLEASQNDLLRLNQPKVKNLLKANFMLGMASHVLDNASLPLSEISIRHEQFGFYTRIQQQELMRHHDEVKEAQNGKDGYFPIEFDIRRRHASENLGTFISGIGTGVAERRTRRDVLAETVTRVENILQRAMAHYLRVPSAEEIFHIGSWKENEIKVWFRDLPEDEPVEAFEGLRVELVELFKDFHQRINGADLDADEVTDLDFYSQVRLYAYAIDKAVTRLPWGQIGNFVINVAAQSSDSSLGARTSYRNYVSKQQLSAFAIGTPEFMGDMLESAMNENNHERTPEDLVRLKSSFKKACETLLSAGGGSK